MSLPLKPSSTGAAARRAKLGTVSLAVFGLAAIWSAVCALWIQSRLPSESALPIIGLLCVLLGLFLSRARRWVAVAGLLLNSSPWIFFLWTVVRDRLGHM